MKIVSKPGCYIAHLNLNIHGTNARNAISIKCNQRYVCFSWPGTGFFEKYRKHTVPLCVSVCVSAYFLSLLLLQEELWSSNIFVLYSKGFSRILHCSILPLIIGSNQSWCTQKSIDVINGLLIILLLPRLAQFPVLSQFLNHMLNYPL